MIKLPVHVLLLVALFLGGVANPLPAEETDQAEIRRLMTAVSAARQKHDAKTAVDLLTQVLAKDKSLADVWRMRGQEQFKLARIKESIDDFDQFAKLQPRRARELWERGISYYYAGRFAEGRKQFEEYQTYHDADVENAAWWFLCTAKEQNVDKARAGLLKVREDSRIPLMTVFDLFAGKKTAADVLAAAQAGKPSAEELHLRMFYAELYLGLYHEATGDNRQAAEHMELAAGKYKHQEYMGIVAQVHLKLMKDRAGKK